MALSTVLEAILAVVDQLEKLILRLVLLALLILGLGRVMRTEMSAWREEQTPVIENAAKPAPHADGAAAQLPPAILNLRSESDLRKSL